jgi:hypothetical protein
MDVKFITAAGIRSLQVKDLTSLTLAKKGVTNGKKSKKADLIEQVTELYVTSKAVEIIVVDEGESTFVCPSEIPAGKKTKTYVQECFALLSSNGVAFNNPNFINPTWLSSINTDFHLTMRVTDYHGRGVESAAISSYFSKLGFDVAHDHDACQIRTSCGIVASTAAASLAESCARSGDAYWHRLLDTTYAVDMENIHACNIFDLDREMNNTDFTSDYEISTMCERMWPDSDGASFEIPAAPDVCSRNGLLRAVVHDLLEVHESKNGLSIPRIIIANTEDNNGDGYHWFVVTYSIRRRVF